jgi:HEPN domain-containing protein
MLAETRLDEARRLLEHRLWSGAYYLAGYAVELALKASIAKQFRSEEIPAPKLTRSIFTHVPVELLVLAGLADERRKLSDANPKFDENWQQVLNWKEDSRYELIAEDRARRLVDAVGDPNNAVLQWIRQHW